MGLAKSVDDLGAGNSFIFFWNFSFKLDRMYPLSQDPKTKIQKQIQR
ncbi:hypothetical protein LEP1GSC202_2600 [Leptospira yanagawae serovar Saopaulo str. Sao Paulo = ATCC 700523]|uniref:Uncharacterized protein n=1 Tax=Leptospira yanagawae serovar Saopaulo str. Sao Paulo = ATCC 700523 TaxID=1249483 RepID=A0A5E8H8M1_9LEPT|nr:hypothetical protein LEP1GSC202_2600 [Leptospira yanagawae serovar Saopaulo str. Sao Paulo = ATCC 700523]